MEEFQEEYLEAMERWHKEEREITLIVEYYAHLTPNARLEYRLGTVFDLSPEGEAFLLSEFDRIDRGLKPRSLSVPISPYLT